MLFCNWVIKSFRISAQMLISVCVLPAPCMYAIQPAKKSFILSLISLKNTITPFN
jgi:hypothetical protein